MNLVIIGSGYVGLVTGACLSQFGHKVTCVDKDERKVSSLAQGEIPIYEPGLDDLVRKNTEEGRLSFTTELAEPVRGADAVFIAVGTPSSRRGDGYADLSYVYGAAKELAKHLLDYTVVIDKSTVPVGTARQVSRIIRDANPSADFDIVSNPEFLREGVAVGDFMHPDRVVFGVESERAVDVLRRVYEPLDAQECPFVFTNLESAELIKYASNAFLAAKISFINEMSCLCEAVGADVSDVARGMGLDQRIGGKFLRVGPGYGGSCFPKDTRALMRIAQEHGVSLRIVEAVVEVNEAQKARMVQKVRKAIGSPEAGKVVGVLGLSFKPDTDDMRESPALTIIPRLQELGVHVKAHDPASMEAAKALLPELEYVHDPYAAAEGADALVLLTEWNEYKALDLERLKGLMRKPRFVDLRNVYDPHNVISAGFDYYSVGR